MRGARSPFSRLWLCSAVLGVALLVAPPVAADEFSRLHILVTNDDGVGAPGLRALREALSAAGHRVTVVAPSAERSGSGAAMTMRGSLALREIEPGVTAVDGTPADCVHIALAMLLDAPPDLVVAGVNFGQNDGVATVVSGTVGAALAAIARGVPAVAVSQTVDADDPRETARFFPDAAAFAAALVDALVRSERRPLLPPYTLLNVNHPARHAADVQGVRLTHQGRTSLYGVDYKLDAEGHYQMSFKRHTAKEPVSDADTAWLVRGYVTITPLDGDWTAGPKVFDSLQPLVTGLGGAAAPAPAR